MGVGPSSLQTTTAVEWHEIILEKHIAEAEVVRENFDNHSNILHVFTRVPVCHEWSTGERNYYFHSMVGSILVMPHGLHASVRRWRSHLGSEWILDFDDSRVMQRVQELGGFERFELNPEFDLYDPHVLRLIQALQADLEAGCLAGSLFGDR